MIGFLFLPDDYPTLAQRVFFIESKGKDISFPRWRFSLYYAPHLAFTHFEPTQEAADAFMAKHSGVCYGSYSDFRRDLVKELQS